MFTPITHLSEILNYTLDSANDFKDEKGKFREWIKIWIIDKSSVQAAFKDCSSEVNQNSNEAILWFAHSSMSVKYFKYITYNYEFITDLKNYITVVYNNYFNNNSRELKQCIRLLKQLQQNMFYESTCDKCDIYPSAQHYGQKFEEYGRAFMKYYNYKKVPFVIEALLRDPTLRLNNAGEDKSDELLLLKFHFYNFIEFIITSNDKDWLQFLYGPILNVKYAMHHHAKFSNIFQKSLWSYDIGKVIEDFSNYLKQIYDSLFREIYIKNIHQTPEICFPAILNVIENNNNNNNNNNTNKYIDYYYDHKKEIVHIPLINSFSHSESYEYILKTILPLWRMKFSKSKNEYISHYPKMGVHYV